MSKVKEEPGVKGEFKEFKLVSAGPTLAHHVMKINHDKFNFVDLTGESAIDRVQSTWLTLCH
jgi:hypothetical protein